MPLAPSFAQEIDFAERSVRFSASGVPMSGRGAPFLMPMPTPERAIEAREAASTLPCFARSSIPALVRTARSKASPPSIWRFKAAASPKVMTSSRPVSRAKTSASSCSASFTPFEARTLISAARIEAVVMRAAMPMTAMKNVLTLIGSPSDFKQITPDDDSAAVVLAHALHPHVVGDRVVVLWDEVRQDERFHSRRGRHLADVLGGGVAGEHVLAQRRRVRHALQEALQAAEVHGFVHENVRALGAGDQLGRIGGVARDHDRAVGGIEAVGVGVHDRRMAHARRADLDVRVLHDEAGLRELVRGDELAQVGPALVGDARLDVEAVEL